MASISYATLQTRFQTELRDTTNITLTSAETTECLTEALNDPFVYTLYQDTSLTTIANQASYTVPSNIYEVLRLAIDYNSDGYPARIRRDNYRVINGVIYFDARMKGIPAGKTINIWGKKRITSSDTIPDIMQEYVIHLALIAAYRMIKASLTTRFVKNDITMSELIASITEHKQAAQDYRTNHPNTLEVGD